MARIVPMTPIFERGKRRHPRAKPTATGQRQPRVKDARYLGFLHELPCVICGARVVEAAHIRFADPERGKPYTGKAEKPSDKWALPLCSYDHREGPDAQHRSNERAWWDRQGIDPIALCEALYAISGDVAQGEQIIAQARQSTRRSLQHA